MAFAMGLPWHEGEEKMHSLMKSPRDHDNPTAPGLSMQAATMLQKAPLLAVGTLDAQNRPWTTLWGGSYGFARPLGAGLIGLRTPVDATYDPVVDALFKSAPPDGSGSGPEAQSKMVGGLTIDLETRKRVKLYGRMAAGGLAEPPDEDDATHKQVEAQLVVRIDQSLGNCPKYLNSKHITAAPTTPTLVSESALLHPDAQVLVSCSDLFFVSSSHSTEDMDTNHRGGPPGFVRLTTTPDGAQTQLVWPEYSESARGVGGVGGGVWGGLWRGAGPGGGGAVCGGWGGGYAVVGGGGGVGCGAGGVVVECEGGGLGTCC
ncbi:hypothetical protein FH972_023263 [Carpinus fangiana]|uniref:Pyridoxamine 5'-phosphate oxidase putative domain-containing protein n=1 Tax=Carpinus fangiana TaxID=176857 RepID=A0A5N6KVB0_9ROSI|nr:hypothetical protein FH972_023263 [Carpinus fangiana]